MTSEDKPGWFGRLFGRKGKDEARPEEAEDESAVGASDTPSADSPASPSEGTPDYATGADDITHIPLPDEDPPIDATEGADLLPVEGEPEKPPAGTAGDPPGTWRPTRSTPAR